MKKRSHHLYDESLRCGRCAISLPDETLTYCPTCGVAFSNVLPTAEYETFADRKKRKVLLRKKTVFFLRAFSIIAMVLFFSHYAHKIHVKRQIHTFLKKPELTFYTYNFAQYPRLKDHGVRNSIAIALQSYLDHFGVLIDQWEVRESSLPPTLENLIQEVGDPLALSRASFWQNFFFQNRARAQKLLLKGERHLPILVTNVPIYLDDRKFFRETSHIGPSEIVAGLGHWSGVVVSTYRVTNVLDIKEESQQERYVGEYLLAHEMGHALLGLEDYVIDRGSQTARGLASLPEYCLMHSYANGETKGWDALKNRQLGHRSTCFDYQNILNAHIIRKKALKLFLDED